MIPEEKKLIEVTLAWVAGQPIVDVREVIEAAKALRKVREKIAASACGEASPTGAMRCTLPVGHSLPDRDNWRFRYHRGVAGDGTRRYWKELRP